MIDVEFPASSIGTDSAVKESQIIMRISEAFEIRSFGVAGERWAAVLLPDRQVLMVGPDGRSRLLSQASLASASHSQALVSQRLQKLSAYLDFVHLTLKWIRAEETKANKKKMSKKDAEKLTAIKAEFLAGSVKQCQDKIAEISECPQFMFKPVRFATTKDLFEAVLALVCTSPTASQEVLGMHTFDLVSGNYLGMDCLGRKLNFSLNELHPHSLKMDYSAALALTNKSGYSPESEPDLKIDSSAGVSTQEFQAFFDANLGLLGAPEICQRLFAFKDGKFSEHFTPQQVSAIEGHYEQLPDFRMVSENPSNGLTKCHLYFEQPSGQRVQSRMKKAIDPTFNMDVCSFQEPQAELEPNFSFFRTFLRPQKSLDLQSFQAALSQHRLWAEDIAATEKVYGNKELAARSPSDFVKAVAMRTAVVRAALPRQSNAEFVGTLNEMSWADEYEAEKPTRADSVRQALRSARQTPRMTAGETQPLDKKNETGPTNYKPPTKCKTASRTSMFLQELCPRYVQNYFDTLEGKQFTRSNPQSPQPVVFGPKELEIVAALRNEASRTTISDIVCIHISKSLESAGLRTTMTASNTVTSDPQNAFKAELESAPVLGTETLKSKKQSQPIRLSSLHERRQMLTRVLAEEEESNRKYHESKSSKFDVYGNPREAVPNVPALLRPVEELKENEDYLLDPIYNHVKGQQARGQVECFVRPSNFHKFRNYAPHQFLAQALDKGFRETGNLNYDLEGKKFMCAKSVPSTDDVIVYPSQVDFGRLTDDGCFELKFAIVNADWLIQKVVVRPPIQAPEISVVYSQEPFAPGLQKTVYVQVNARALPKGLFVHNVIVETKYRSYKVRVSGLVVPAREKLVVEIPSPQEPVFTTLKSPTRVRPVAQKVKNLLNPYQGESGRTSEEDPKGSVCKTSSKLDSEGTHSDALPRLCYDKNFTVG